MAETTKERLNKQFAQLESERQSFEPHWRELSDYINPRGSRFLTSEVNRNDRRNTRIIDSTGTMAARTLASGMMSGITSPARPWFRLATPDPEMMDYGPVKLWLEAVQNRMNDMFNKSNLYQSLPQLYGSLGTYSTGAMAVLEDDEEYQNPVDLLFEELAKKKPNSFAGRQYKLYKLAAGKTAKSILISCGARLAPFDIQELRDLTMYDELQLDTLGDKKTALFLIMSDTDSTFNFLISMVYTQLFNLLCDKADDVYGGKLPVHVRCLIDECANIGQIPNLEKLVATIRSREISACLVLQARSQLKAIYKDNADTIVGNMDSQIFLGGSEPTTLKDLSEMLGKETIDAFNTSDTRGNSPSYGTTFQKMGHELLSRDELAVLDGGKCILQLRGVRPFLSDKYDLTQHPNYKLTSDYDPKNTFDIEKYLNRKEKIHPGDEFIVVNADSLPPA